jgi:L-alanine-DL-glutamate epimerase-like enolase superfamily enzyme
VRSADMLGKPPVRTLADVRALGAEAASRGYRALKTNLFIFDGAVPRGYSPGFGFGAGHPELNLDTPTLDAIVAQMAAFREGAGPGMGLMLDLNFNFKPAGLKRIAKAVEHLNLTWLEMDTYDARALADVRQSTSTPIGSMEAIYHRDNCLPFFEHRAVDYAIIDVMWNGMSEAVKIATLADTFSVNINSHCFSSTLGLLMGAHLCAVAPNFHFAEMDVDQVPWNDELFTDGVVVENGELLLPTRPGWGVDVNEEALLAHQPSEEDRAKWFLSKSRGAG